MKKVLFICIILFNMWPAGLIAFDNESTHRDLTERAATISSLVNTQFLQDKLGLANGTSTVINKQNITQWLQAGAKKEDEPLFRASSHFHNPLRNWDVSGVRDLPLTFKLACIAAGYPPKSNIHWATGYSSPSTKSPTGNQWDWNAAREHYYTYVTGKDSLGIMVASTKQEKEIYLTKALQALGQTIHLLQDMAVPAHVRDDFMSHMGVYDGKRKDYYEYWVQQRENWNRVGFRPPIRSGLTNQMVATFWDTNTYIGQDPDLISPSTPRGLAEYTNMNFASKNTFFTESRPVTDVYHHPYPAKASTDLPAYEQHGKLPETITDKDGINIQVHYIKKERDGEQVDHFAKPTYFTDHLKDMNGYEIYYRSSFVVDNECAKDYASFLVPRAIGYSADLIDYFFRALDIWPGIELIHATVDDLATPVVRIKAWVRNGSPEAPIGDESLATTGQIMGIVQYKTSPTGETLYAVSAPKDLNPFDPNTVYPNFNSAYDLFTFDFSGSPIPANVADMRFQVVYKGTIGGEKETGIAVGMTPSQQIIEVTPPDRFVYAITDGEIKAGKTQQEFTSIKLKASAFLSTPLPQGGQLTAVAYYRPWVNYRPDLDPSIYPPIRGNPVYATSASVTLSSPLEETEQEFTFDFTNTPIPVGITDLTLEVQYRTPSGTLTARGEKDLLEPTHIAAINNTGYFYFDHNLLSGTQVWNNPSYRPWVDGGTKPTRPNECSKGDVYIDPFSLDIRLLFCRDTDASQPPFDDSTFLATYTNVPAGKHVRLILLTGTPQFKRWIHYGPAVGSPAEGCRYAARDIGDLIWSVKNQADEESSPILFTSKVGINAHDLLGVFSWVYPDSTGIGEANWPSLVDLYPVPVTSIQP